MQHSINLAPEKDTLDGRHLDKLIKLWLDWCESYLPPSTVHGYKDKVSYFTGWWADVGPWHNYELSEDTLIQFNRWLNSARSNRGGPLAYNTRLDVLRRLRQCLRWAFQRGYTNQRDFSVWVPKPDGSAPLRQRASLEDLSALMLAAGKSIYPLRDKALIALFIGTGVRRSEAIGLDVSDLRMDADSSGTASIRKAKRVKGRAVQGRVVAFDAWTGSYLAALLDSLPPAGPLFRIPDGDRRIGSQAAYRIVKRAIKRAGMEDRIQGPHDLRRNFTTWFARTHRGDAYGRLLSKQLGHSSSAMTGRYDLSDVDDLREVIVSPLAGVSQPYIDSDTPHEGKDA